MVLFGNINRISFIESNEYNQQGIELASTDDENFNSNCINGYCNCYMVLCCNLISNRKNIKMQLII